MYELPDELNLVKITERKRKQREAEEAMGIKSLTLECPECGAPETDIGVDELNADRSQEAYCFNCGLIAPVEEFEK